MKYFFLVFYLAGFFASLQCLPPAITFSGGGRLGDKLIIYCKAKWFAYKYSVQFLCPDFPYKDLLMLSKKERKLTYQIENGYKNRRIVKVEQDLLPLKNDTLYYVDFYAHSEEMSDVFTMKNVFNAHPFFLNELRTLIAPCKSIPKLMLPADKISVAVHVRKGSGHDLPLLSRNRKQGSNVEYSDKRWPAKFPPDEYYLAEIKELSSLLGNKPLYVFIFTDHDRPAQIVEKYKKILNLPNITFAHRATQSYEHTMINDMLDMAQFEYLIRPYSLFSAISYLLGDHTFMVYPIDSVWYDTLLVINKVMKGIKNEDGIIIKHVIAQEVRLR